MAKLVHCKPDDPRRCKAGGQYGTCPFLAAEGVTNCVRHAGTVQQDRKEKESIEMYKLAQWSERLKELGDTVESRTLTQEVGVLRMTLEAILNKCQDTDDLFTYSSRIGDISIKIEKLVSAVHRMEHASGQMMDRSAALHFAATVVEIVDSVVRTIIKDEDLCDAVTTAIGDRIMTVLTKFKTEDK